MFRLPAGAQYIISRLMKCGFEAYVVGGCVRDKMLSKEPDDWDICTNAHPNTVASIFRDCHVIPAGVRHGTLTVESFGDMYEVTTYRIDGEYSDFRRPSRVEFTSDITKDLSRRDFTINAIAYNEKAGFIDPFDGAGDLLSRRLIRCVGNAEDRFNEDALRIMRAIRFSSILGFRIEEKTSDAIHRNKHLLDHIAAERINVELRKLLTGKHALPVLLEYSDVIAQIIPEFAQCIGFDQHNKYHVYTVYEHIMRAMNNYTGDDETVRLALFFHDIGKPQCYTEDENGGHFHGHGVPSSDMTSEIMTRLRFDNQTKNDVAALVLYHDATIEPTKKTVRRWFNKIGTSLFLRLLQVRKADILAHAPETIQSRLDRCDALEKLANEIMDEAECFSLKDLAVKGEDVMRLGVPEGKEVGRLLNEALCAVINEAVKNDHDELIAYLSRRLA